MIKKFCDCCLNETSVTYDFNYYVHIENNNKFAGYETIDGDTVSGKLIEKDLCLKCYNKIFGDAYKTFQNIKYSVLHDQLEAATGDIMKESEEFKIIK